MTQRNKSAGNNVSEVLPDEPSGLSGGKPQLDYFLLPHCGEATTQALFAKCISYSKIFLNTFHLRGENNAVPWPPVKLAQKSPVLKNHFPIGYVDKINGGCNQELCLSANGSELILTRWVMNSMAL